MKMLKSLDEIKKEVAKECAEEHFDAIFEAEILVCDDDLQTTFLGVPITFCRLF